MISSKLHHNRPLLLRCFVCTKASSKTPKISRTATARPQQRFYVTYRQRNVLYQFCDSLPPLGALSASQWEECLSAMAHGLAVPVNGENVWAVHGLLHRLRAEQYTNNIASRTQNLKQWQLPLLQAWLVLASEHPASLMAVQHATQTFQQLVLDRDTFPLDEAVSVVQAWLEYGDTVVGTTQASQMLLSKTFLDSVADQSTRIMPLYQLALQRTLQHSLDAAHWVTFLQSVWNQPEWQTLIDHLAILEATRGVSSSATLTTFEHDALEQVLIQQLERATADDRAMVDALKTSPSTAVSLAVVDYYLRMADPVAATPWLARLDKTPATRPRYLAILQLWVEHHTDGPDTAYRVEEWLQGLAEFKEPIDVSLYTSVARRWSAIGGTVGNQKVVSLLDRAKTLDREMWQVAAVTTSSLEQLHVLLDRCLKVHDDDVETAVGIAWGIVEIGRSRGLVVQQTTYVMVCQLLHRYRGLLDRSLHETIKNRARTVYAKAKEDNVVGQKLKSTLRRFFSPEEWYQLKTAHPDQESKQSTTQMEDTSLAKSVG